MRPRLTYANVMATAAVFIALGGGAYAVSLAKNTVGSKQIKKDAVRASEIRRDAVRGDEVGDRSLTAAEFAPGALLPNVVKRQGSPVMVPSRASAGSPPGASNATASCEPGERAVGGGGAMGPTDGAADGPIGITSSVPGGDPGATPSSWVVRGQNYSLTESRQVIATVVCASP